MELKELRNKMATGFLLINAIFIVVLYALQLNMDSLYVKWPCGDDMRVEPLGFVFMIVFGVIMAIQTLGMLFHRTSTFLHIVSTTKLNCFRNSGKSDTQIAEAAATAGAANGGRGGRVASDDVEYLIDLAKKMGRLAYEDRMSVSSRYSTWRTDPDSALADGDDVRMDYNNRRTVIKLERKQKKGASRQLFVPSVNEAFKKRFDRLETQLDDDNVDISTLQNQVFVI